MCLPNFLCQRQMHTDTRLLFSVLVVPKCIAIYRMMMYYKSPLIFAKSISLEQLHNLSSKIQRNNNKNRCSFICCLEMNHANWSENVIFYWPFEIYTCERQGSLSIRRVVHYISIKHLSTSEKFKLFHVSLSNFCLHYAKKHWK